MPRPGTDGALACAVMHVLFKGASPTAPISQDTPTCRGARGASRERDAGVGGGDHRRAGSDDRRFRAALRPHQAELHPHRLRLLALAQRCGAALAVTCLPAVTGAWQIAAAARFMPMAGSTARPHPDRRARRARSQDAHPRSVAYRPDPDRRPARPRRRAAGDGAADPEHQSHGGLPGDRTACARVSRARTSSSASTSSS